MKAFVEWEQHVKEGFIRPSFEEVVKQTREGFVHADSVITVPGVDEWPSDVDGISIQFYKKVGFNSIYTKTIKDIPRPAPAYTPKVGDAVFYSNGCNVTLIVDGFSENGLYKSKDFGFIPCDQVKPFNAKYIGEPWDMIPSF